MLTLDTTLDEIKKFPFEQREELIEILQKRQSQEWRNETAEYYESIKESVHNGKLESMCASEAIGVLHELLNSAD